MAAPFIFGKLPAHGDFVARGLDAGVQQAWDDWASREIEAAREALGEAFEAAHDAAPPWGFIAGPGPLGEGWRWGAVAASVDSAGRRFLVVAGFDGLEAAEAAFLGLHGVAEAEAAIRAMLLQGLGADAGLDQLLVPAAMREAAQIFSARPKTGVWWSTGGIVPPVAGDAPPPGLVASAIERIAALLREEAA